MGNRRPGWRSCKGCTTCCTTMAVPDLPDPKRVFKPCEHVAKRGCRIYKTRPDSCREFFCLWITQPKLVPKKLWPKDSGMSMHISSDKSPSGRHLLQINVDPRFESFNKIVEGPIGGLVKGWVDKMSQHFTVAIVEEGWRSIIENGAVINQWQVDEDHQHAVDLSQLRGGGSPPADSGTQP